jgi:hypothetical protein
MRRLPRTSSDGFLVQSQFVLPVVHGQENGAGSSDPLRQSAAGVAEPRGAGIGWQTRISVLFELRMHAEGATDGRSQSVTVV